MHTLIIIKLSVHFTVLNLDIGLAITLTLKKQALFLTPTSQMHKMMPRESEEHTQAMHFTTISTAEICRKKI